MQNIYLIHSATVFMHNNVHKQIIVPVSMYNYILVLL